MLLKLSLPKGKVVWALAHPASREYIHKVSGVGYQGCRLIITEKEQPVVVTLEDYPKWAQNMILTSIQFGDIINTGDSISQPKKQETLEALDIVKPKTKQTRKPGPTKI